MGQARALGWAAALALTTALASPAHALELKTTIWGELTPKSVGYSGHGLFFAQNMMYTHTVTVYDRDFRLVKTISDEVRPTDYGYRSVKGELQGAPVEVTFTEAGRFAWVTNYAMEGPGYSQPGHDRCSPAEGHDDSFVYKIDTSTLEIVQIVEVGAVPKFIAASPDGRYVLVSNWCDWNVSVLDAATGKELRRVAVGGSYPRGIAFDPQSQRAYVAVMGGHDLAVISLSDFSVTKYRDVGKAPRSIVADPSGKYLYVTLNSEGKVAQVDAHTGEVLRKVRTGRAPRSMAISDDSKYLYVTNYGSDTMSKLRAEDMTVLETVPTNHPPIGITYDPVRKQVWVACYSGSLMVFQDGEPAPAGPATASATPAEPASPAEPHKRRHRKRPPKVEAD